MGDPVAWQTGRDLATNARRGCASYDTTPLTAQWERADRSKMGVLFPLGREASPEGVPQGPGFGAMRAFKDLHPTWDQIQRPQSIAICQPKGAHAGHRIEPISVDNHVRRASCGHQQRNR